MRHLRHRVPITVGIIAAALLGASTTVAATPAPPPHAPAVPSAVPAAAPDGGTTNIDGTGAADDAVSVSQICTFYTNGDYVHVSSTAFEASGHGWWTNVNCSATYAVVTVVLQEYYSDGSWRDKGSGQATVRSGGGSGNRATGRAACNDANGTGWRSVIDIDLVGLADDPGKLTTPAQNIGCRRY